MLREGDGVQLPAGVVMTTGSTQGLGNAVHVRFCNARNVAAPAINNFPVRWYAFTP